MQKNMGGEISFEGGRGWVRKKKKHNNIYLSWTKSGVLLTSGACTYLTRKEQETLHMAASCVSYRGKPFPGSQGSKECVLCPSHCSQTQVLVRRQAGVTHESVTQHRSTLSLWGMNPFSSAEI